MTQGIYYLLTLIAIGVVIRWFIQNDRIKPGERTTGILSMDRAANKAEKAEKNSRFLRRPATLPRGTHQP